MMTLGSSASRWRLWAVNPACLRMGSSSSKTGFQAAKSATRSLTNLLGPGGGGGAGAGQQLIGAADSDELAGDVVRVGGQDLRRVAAVPAAVQPVDVAGDELRVVVDRAQPGLVRGRVVDLAEDVLQPLAFVHLGNHLVVDGAEEGGGGGKGVLDALLAGGGGAGAGAEGEGGQRRQRRQG